MRQAPPKVDLAKQAWPREWVAGDLDSFYGNPRGAGGRADAQWEAANLTTITTPWGTHVYCHRKCADSLTRIFAATWDRVGKDAAKLAQFHTNEYDGSYNYRANVNNPAKLSLHAYGAAIDIAAAENPNGKRWADDGRMLPRWFIDFFLAEGWSWGGDFSGTPDAMHFQATFNRHADAPQDQPHSLPTLPPDLYPGEQRYTKIIATVFGGASDRNTSAYDGHVISDSEPGCALPYHFPEPRPHVTVFGPKGTATVPIVDVGPIYPSQRGPADLYWHTNTRPRAETNHVLSQAGIDLTPATARVVGIDGKGTVDWCFAAAPSAPAPSSPVAAEPDLDEIRRLIAGAQNARLIIDALKKQLGIS